MADSRRSSLANFDFGPASKSRPMPKAKAKARTVLQLHVPDGWPNLTSAEEPRFRWALWDGVDSQFGISPLREIAQAEDIIVVIPMNRATFVRVKIPVGNPKKIDKMLPYLIEDQTASSPEDIQAVLVERRHPADESLVLVADKAWIAQARGELEVQGFAPARMIVEAELLDGANIGEAWTVVRTPTGGFVHFPDGESVALDGISDDVSISVPPMALTLVVDERNAMGEIPPSIRVLTTERLAPPDALRWSQALSVRVVTEGEWRPERIDARGRSRTNLITRPSGDAANAEWLDRFKWPMVAFASVFCLHAIVTVVDWLRLRNEATSIRAEMNARFRSVFPDAKAIVDPALQMSRNLADLRRSGGEPDPSDFVPLLAQIAGKLGPSGVKPQKVRYEKGQLQLDLPISAGETKESIEAKLAAEGLRIQVETVTSSTASVRVTVSGKGA